MPGKVIPCALCQAEAASVFCVNDDAHLCASCDASVHSSNPLLARHERRPLSALGCTAECASAAAPSGAPAASAATASTDGDVGVVPQQARPVVAEAEAAPGPMALYEDSFLGRSLTTNDLLDLDDLELPGCSGAAATAPFAFDPLDDCVVPSWGDDALRSADGDRYMQATSLHASEQSSFLSHPYMPPAYLRHQPYTKPQQQPPVPLVPLGFSAAAKPAATMTHAGVVSAADAEAEAAARVQRHRERQRKKRAFGRAVRYQSRRAYAEIRPRIKGRFVTPEEYAAYKAHQGGGGADADMQDGYAYGLPDAVPGADPMGSDGGLFEEDAVVPAPAAFVAAL